MLETVPNFSEGRDPATVDALVRALGSAGARVADVHVDADHHRCVLTAFGSSSELAAGLENAVAVAVERIDLRTHEGVHPRVGACDVLPVVPLAGLVPGGGDERDAQALASDVAARIGGLGVPVIRYGSGAERGAEFAGAVRTGGAAGLAARLASGELRPHAGPAEPHMSAGAVLVGVRDVLVAFNVDLATDDLHIARRIAGTIRERAGGLPGVRALGLPLARAGRVQVSTNAEQWRSCGPGQILLAVAECAAAAGVRIARCELVGLAPRDAVAGLDQARRDCAQVAECPDPAGLLPLAAAAEPRLEAHAESTR